MLVFNHLNVYFTVFLPFYFCQKKEKCNINKVYYYHCKRELVLNGLPCFSKGDDDEEEAFLGFWDRCCNKEDFSATKD